MYLFACNHTMCFHPLHIVLYPFITISLCSFTIAESRYAHVSYSEHIRQIYAHASVAAILLIVITKTPSDTEGDTSEGAREGYYDENSYDVITVWNWPVITGDKLSRADPAEMRIQDLPGIRKLILYAKLLCHTDRSYGQMRRIQPWKC